MHAKPIRNASRKTGRLTGIAFVLALALAAIAGGAHAQVLVTDTGAIAQLGTANGQLVSTYARQFLQLSHEINTDLQTLETYQALMASIQNVINNPIGALIPANTTMAQLSQSQIAGIAQQQCGGGNSGSLVADAIGTLANAIDLGGSNIAQSQQQLCEGVIVAQADQYNATADLYNQMPQFHKSLGGLDGLIASISNVSGGNANTQATTFTAQQQQAIMDWRTRVTMDQQVVQSLQSQQQVFAQILIKGNPGLAGEAIQTAVFAGAFH